MKKFFKDFGDFIKRGNVLDLAVGLIIGNAFNAIVKSLVNDVIMPVIGLIGGKNVSEAKWVFVPAVYDETGAVVSPEVAMYYGSFIQTIIDFLIIALTIFVIVKVVTTLRERAEKRLQALKEKLRKEELEAQAAQEQTEETIEEVKPTTEDILLEIRDLLKEKKEENQNE